MAARQQQQIENQQQVLVAKEQRLKYLKQQDQRQQHIVAEGDRLKKLRDRVESQEMKLKKLRALRGEVDKHRNTNGTLSKKRKQKNLNMFLKSLYALLSQELNKSSLVDRSKFLCWTNIRNYKYESFFVTLSYLRKQFLACL